MEITYTSYNPSDLGEAELRLGDQRPSALQADTLEQSQHEWPMWLEKWRGERYGLLTTNQPQGPERWQSLS